MMVGQSGLQAWFVGEKEKSGSGYIFYYTVNTDNKINKNLMHALTNISL